MNIAADDNVDNIKDTTIFVTEDVSCWHKIFDSVIDTDHNASNGDVTAITSSLPKIDGEVIVFQSANWANDSNNALLFVDSNNTSSNNDIFVVDGSVVVYDTVHVDDTTNAYADIIYVGIHNNKGN